MERGCFPFLYTIPLCLLRDNGLVYETEEKHLLLNQEILLTSNGGVVQGRHKYLSWRALQK